MNGRSKQPQIAQIITDFSVLIGEIGGNYFSLARQASGACWIQFDPDIIIIPRGK